MKKIKNILVPTDFSDGCADALNYAVQISAATGARLHIVHAIEPIVFSSDIVMTKYGFDELSNELEIFAKKDFEKLTKKLTDRNVAFQTKLLHGKAFEKILEYAQGNRIDMICIASHGRGNFEKLFFGSTTEKVLRKSQCPVLVVRKRNEDQ
jgi:nucleotide-binding universal stress UspA family protein